MGSGKIFLFYSELLRLQSNKENYGAAMHRFLYEAAHKNRPYDEVVHDMLSSRGHIAENPAVAYCWGHGDDSEQCFEFVQVF